MGLLSSIRISASALAAQRLRMDVVANNVANMNSTRGLDGGPFRRQVVSLREMPDSRSAFTALLNRSSALGQPRKGVAINRIETDMSPGRRSFDPSNPDADEDGFVELSNVNLVVEMTDMVAATRSYEASITVLNAAKTMALRALDIARR
ncbi:MAG: flagellar basal body rod protein FlgC [Dehalococcoidia bacterium]